MGIVGIMGGMNIHFITCDRARALDFIRCVYPDKVITDTPESAGKLLDFVERDIVRIQDPHMYGKRIQVVQSVNWKDEYLAEVVAACEQFA